MPVATQPLANAPPSAIRRAATAVIATGGALALLTGTANAFVCEVPDKPSGAGAVTEEDVKFTKSGRIVVPGAFFSEGGTDVFIRGGGHKDPEDPQFGMATDQALCNGPDDHGVVDSSGELCPSE